LAEDREEADRLAGEIEAANTERRGLTKSALAEARLALGLVSEGGGQRGRRARRRRSRLQMRRSLPPC